LVSDGVEHARLRRAGSHELRHVPQGGLFIGERAQISGRLRNIVRRRRTGVPLSALHAASIAPNPPRRHSSTIQSHRVRSGNLRDP
jgi:hypothetical protein